MSRDLILLIALPFILDTIEDQTSVYYDLASVLKFSAVQRFSFRQVLSEKRKIGGWRETNGSSWHIHSVVEGAR